MMQNDGYSDYPSMPRRASGNPRTRQVNRSSESKPSAYNRNNPRYTERSRTGANARQQRPSGARAYTGERTYPAASGRRRQAVATRPLLPRLLKAVLVIAIVAAAAFAAVKGAEAIGSMFSKASAEGDALPVTGAGGTGFDSALSEAVAPRTITVSFAGDCTLGTDVNFDTTRNFNAMYDSVDDPSYFLANVYDIFSKDDLTVVNVEGTLTTSTTRVEKQFAFKGPMEYAGILTAGDVEIGTFANNHDSDYGKQSHEDTVDALEAEGIIVASEDKIAYTEVNGIKVAVIAVYELDYHREREDDVREYITTARDEGAELVLVYFHWGNEREYAPDDNEIYMGHMAIDAGADMIVGSHPHVLQGYECYNGRYIFYSLGNFCYGGHSNPQDKDSVVVQKTFTFDESGLVLDDAINVIPCSISSTSSRNNYQPTPATGEELERMEEKWAELNENVKDALDAYNG